MATTIYLPVAKVSALAMLGFCSVDVKLLGPLQLYVAPADVVANRVSVLPEHTGVLLDAVVLAGFAFTVTDVVDALEVHPFLAMVSEYVPDCVVAAFAITGFCDDDVKLPGPVHAQVTPAESAVA